MAYCNHCALPFPGDQVQLLFPEWTEQGIQVFYCDRPSCLEFYNALPQERKEPPSTPEPVKEEDTHSLSEEEESEEETDEQWEERKQRLTKQLTDLTLEYVDNMREEEGLPRVYTEDRKAFKADPANWAPQHEHYNVYP